MNDTHDSWPARRLWSAVAAVTLIGLVVRLLPALVSGFPAGDGGMFAVMIGDIRDNGYRLPEFTSYNAERIPFVYPPLPFYLAGALSDVTGTSVETWLRFLPLLVSTATIPLFFLLARKLMGRTEVAIFASTIFALVPRAFNWEVIGGGITRSFGLFFALLAIYFALRMYRGGTRRLMAAVVVSAAMTVFTHPEMVAFVTVSMAVLWWFEASHSRPAALHTLLTAAGTLALTAPWWGWMLLRHGPDPFISAAQTNGATALSFLALVMPWTFGEPAFPFVLGLALLGGFAAWGRGMRFLPVWFVILFIADPRKAPTYATIPGAMLAAIAVHDVLVPLLRADGDNARPWSRGQRLAVNGIVMALFLAALAAPVAKYAPLQTVSEDTREAMRAAGAQAPEGAAFVVLDGRDKWARDFVSEWFPALAQRRSVATVQGSEWLGGDRWRKRQEQHEELQECADRPVDCLEAWEAKWHTGFTRVFVPKKQFGGVFFGDDTCCRAARASLATSPAYRQVLDLPGGTVFERVP